ncbi:ABC transporter permease [archaeon SCG-AAA382B04]|nr:ABC transporter permease [archaeon SCG-AAA382B04]
MVFEILYYEGKRRLRSSTVLTILFSALALFYISFFPSVKEMGEEMMAGLPDAVIEMFGGLGAFTTIEGYLAAEVYIIFWTVFVGIYFAYSAANLIVNDIQKEKMDLVLSYPVSRRQIIIEKTSAFGVPLLLLNAVVPVAIYIGISLIGETIEPLRLVMVHLLSIPYLLVCIAIGLFLSVVVDRAKIARYASIGAIFGLYLISNIISMAKNFEWIGLITPSHYFDPPKILRQATYNYTNATILLIAFFVIFIASMEIFKRKDI